MATIVLTIAGVAKEFKAGSLHISYTANGRSTASFIVLSTDGTYRPAIGSEVIITEDGTRILGGLIDKPQELGILPGYAAIQTKVSVVDFHTYTDRRYVNEAFASQSLLARLTSLTTYLAGYGVTLHGSQVTGPTLPAVEYVYRPLTEVLNETATLTAEHGEPFVWRIDHTKVLRMFQPTTSAAPFNISGASLPIPQVIGDIEVEPTREHYANKIIVKVPAKTEMNRNETFTGDGTTATFQLQYEPFAFRLATRNGDQYETVTTPEFDGQAYWTFDPEDNTITRTAGAPGDGDTISFNFDGTFSGEGIADAGAAASDLVEKVIVLENVPADETAQSIADSELAKRQITTKRIKYKTFEAGLIPGQTQTINVSRRDLSVTAVITDVVTRDFGKDRLIRDVTAIVDGDTNLDKGWRDVYKVWAGDKTGASLVPAVAAGSAPVASAGPAPPRKSVQFNDDLRFGGDAAFTFDKTTTTVMIGTDHTPGEARNLLIGEGHTVN